MIREQLRQPVSAVRPVELPDVVLKFLLVLFDGRNIVKRGGQAAVHRNQYRVEPARSACLLLPDLALLLAGLQGIGQPIWQIGTW